MCLHFLSEVLPLQLGALPRHEAAVVATAAAIAIPLAGSHPSGKVVTVSAGQFWHLSWSKICQSVRLKSL